MHCDLIALPHNLGYTVFERLCAMKTPRVYIETSVFNFVFTDDAPEKKQDALKFFAEIKAGLYEPFTSQYAIDELSDAPEEKRRKMLNLLTDYRIKLIETSDDAVRLADLYVAEGVIPLKYRTDALHIAIASVMELDFVVSYNFRHIVKRKTIVLSGAINQREGLRQIAIFSPTEVIESDDE